MQFPKKRRRPKVELEKWLKEQQELKENRPLFEEKLKHNFLLILRR